MSLLEFNTKNYFDEMEYFTAADGLNIAAGPWKELDPTYATFSALRIHFGYDPESGEQFFNLSPLSTHRCTLEELGLTSDTSKSRFYRINSQRL